MTAPRPLCVLLVEDNVDDAELVLGAVRQAGFLPTSTRVDTEAAFLSALATPPDIILSDYSMPSFNGIRAAELLQRTGLGVPFILISGTVGEEVAVEAMRHGATDYLLKDRLGRLGSAITRALDESVARRERTRVDADLRATQEQLRRTLEHSPMVIFSLRVDEERLVLQSVNENVTRQLGFTVEEASATDWWAERLHPDERERVFAEFARNLVVDSGVSAVSEYRLRHRDGHYIWVEDHRRTVRDANGIVREISGVWLDVTDRRESQRSLERLHRSHRWILDSVDEGIYGMDSEGRITFANVAAARMLGVEADALVGVTGHDVFHHSLADGTPLSIDDCRIQATLRDGIPRRVADEVFWRADGKSFPVEYGAAQKRDDEGTSTGVVVVFHSIADRLSLEAQLRQSQKMESVGRLAGGIAHDFNNILSVIMFQAELAASVDGIPEIAREELSGILDAAQRAANLTRQLLLFSRKQVMLTRRLEVNDVVTGLVQMLQRIVPANVQLKLQLHPVPLVVFADASMLDQVLMNLTVNACDAMPTGGSLTISTTAIDVGPQRTQRNPEARAGRFVRLGVTDSGTGIPIEMQSRIFEPFFTTKEPGKGTGLGLATAFGIVKQHNGWLELTSDVGHGTRFDVFLPVIDPASEPGEGRQMDVVSAHSGNETILLAEDDEFVRRLTRLTLERAGYRVFDAADGVAAKRLWQAHRGEIALLVTDLIMPGGVDGRELAARLRDDEPTLKMLFTSGYSASIAGRELTLDPGQRFLQKPSTPQAFLAAVRGCLDGADAPRATETPRGGSA